MTAMTPRAVSHLFAGTYSESEIIGVAQKLRTQLGGNAALGFVFATPEWRDHLEDTLELIRLHARVPRLETDQFESVPRSEEHTSELQSLRHLVCRLLLEKKKRNIILISL